MFAFVWDNGTDPELVLRIEAVTNDDVATWHYQPIRFTWRELMLNHNGKQVWQKAEFLQHDAPMQSTPYITGLTERVPTELDK